jgi:hypothetical protein
MFQVGDKVNVLLPWWTQVHDDVEPYVSATVISAGNETVRVEYDTPNGKSDVVIELDRISKA